MLEARDIELISSISGMSGECQSITEFVDAVLVPMTELFKSNSSLFYTNSNQTPGLSLQDCFANNLDTLYCDIYQSNYHQQDPCYALLGQNSHESKCVSVSTDQAIGREHHYINSAYYEDFLQPQNIHQSLIFTIADRKNYYGLFGLHRPLHKGAYEQSDHLKAKLLASHFSTSLKALQATMARNDEQQALAAMMARSSMLGFITVNTQGNITAKSADLTNKIQGLVAIPDHQLWPMLLDSFTPETRQFCINALRGDTLQVTDSIEVPSCAEKQLPALFISVPEMGKLTVFFLNEGARNNISQGKLKHFNLTRRQQDVIHLISEGLTNTQIADKMGVSPKTLESHLTAIYRKTACHNKTGLLSALRP
ncbi:hypothetical protein KFE96_15935 [Kordiimonas sp. SCSIO 12603]|uniref:response regulator transcription factor n=1 Tax=Kordiimonas sp. SCSIO 12603 TaxID=2829596 RepID=UPI002102A1F6|nr:LuxR family transcriptional regulator [Kordiimonas sp. SCSIO 12603]UTW58295.1 hypothetical protein KFE96_15935 [Kordiimonas sp. SCSIO 12603]